MENIKKERKTILTAIDLLTCLGSIASLLKTDEREPLGAIRIPIFGQKHPRHTAKPFENLAQVVFFGEFRHL